MSQVGNLLGQFHRRVTEVRSERYSPSSAIGIGPEWKRIFPTPLDQQYNFAMPYDAYLEGAAGDLYSVFYKPIMITLLASGCLLSAIGHAFHGAGDMVEALASFFPEQETASPEFDDEPAGAIQHLGAAVMYVAAAAYLLGFWLVVDTLASVTSLVLRSLLSALNKAAELFPTETETPSVTA